MRVAIVGAGIMGRILAWKLLRAGIRPELFDRDSRETGAAASYTAAGMLAPYSELESGESLVFRMGMRSLELWAQLARELGDIGYRSSGSLVVAHHQDRTEMQRFRQRLAGKLMEDRLTDNRIDLSLDNANLSDLEPVLAHRFTNALYLPAEACVDNLKVMAQLAAQLDRAAVPWHAQHEVDSMMPGKLITKSGEHRFDSVIDCRGLGAKADITGLRAVRGELLQVSAPDVAIHHMIRLLHPRYQLYLVPRGTGSYLLGATQIESEDFSPVSVRSALELLSALYSLHEGFSEARITGWRSNCRPALPSNLPLISLHPGLLRINGLFRHGFLLAPVLARQVVDYLLTGTQVPSDWPDIMRSVVPEPRRETVRNNLT